VRFDSVNSPTTSMAANAAESPQQQQQQHIGQATAAAAAFGCALDSMITHSVSTGSMQLLDGSAAAAAAAAADLAAGVGSGPVSDGVLLAALRRQLQAEGGPSGEMPLSLAPTLSISTQL
jgi:hypothetical protein